MHTPDRAEERVHREVAAGESGAGPERTSHAHALRQHVPGPTALVVVDIVPFFVAASPCARGIVPTISLLATIVRTA